MKPNWHKVFCLLLLYGAILCQTSCRHKDQPNTPGGIVVSDSTKPAADSMTFIVLGDWGRKGGEYQTAVAEQMAIYAAKFHTQFVITTGDNFYESGVTSINDPHWKASFENIYSAPSLQVDWYPTLGNHDYHSNPQAQVEYSAASKRWKMPARYYAIEKQLDTGHKVLFAFTDTSPFVTEYYQSPASKSDLAKQDTAAQLAWLSQLLRSSKDDWKIVVGHHPVYSGGKHGGTDELIGRFKPIFVETKTDFYLCGHDHVLEYMVQPSEPTHYLISGGGSEKYPIYQNPYDHFAKSTPGFLVMTLYADKVNFYFYDEKGELLFNEQVKK